MLVVLFSLPALAQEATIQVQRGPYYVGDSIEIQIIASQFDGDEDPEVTPPPVVDGTLQYGGVSENSSTSISVVNGKITRTRVVQQLYRYEFVSDKAGRVRIPPFTVSAGSTRRTTRAVDLEISSVPTTGLVGVEVVLRPGPIFVGEKVPVELRVRIDRGALDEVVSLDTSVPLFDLENVRFIDEPDAEASTTLEVRTQAGRIGLPARTNERTVKGRRFVELQARRTMIMLAPIETNVSAPRVTVTRGTGFRQDIFGRRQAVASERLQAAGEPIALEVIEVPREGRPASFAGAVGQGFSLEVTADRSVVQLGEPISLSFHLRGDGDLSMAGLPPFDAAGLFDPSLFRVPTEAPAGLVDASGKRFQASVRVLDASVREIPSLAYSWFDAETRRFETVHSRPIALSVGAARIIGAEDVDRRTDPDPDAADPREEELAFEEETKARSTSLVVSGANLAVVTETALVLGSDVSSRAVSPLVPAFYALGCGLLGFAAYDHRRRARDPHVVRRAAAFDRAERGIAAAQRESGAEAATALGRVLRELIAEAPEMANADCDALLAECDALRFAPGGSSGAVPEALFARATEFVRARREEAGG